MRANYIEEKMQSKRSKGYLEDTRETLELSNLTVEKKSNSNVMALKKAKDSKIKGKLNSSLKAFFFVKDEDASLESSILAEL